MKIAPNVDGSAAHASEKLTVSVVVVTPKGMPMSVVDNDRNQDAAFDILQRQDDRQNQSDQKYPEHRLIQC